MAAGDLESSDEDLDEDDLNEYVTLGGLMHQLDKNPSQDNKNMTMLSMRFREADDFMKNLFPAYEEVHAQLTNRKVEAQAANLQQQKLGNLIDHSMANAQNFSEVAAVGQLAAG